PEYYIVLDSLIQKAKERYVTKYYEINEYGRWREKKDPYDMIGSAYDEIKFPFFPVVGNHDLTHNGWALWSNIFHSSFYEFDVNCGYDDEGNQISDHFIFLDTASGTLGKRQVDLIEEGILDGENHYRYTFVFSHTNIFLPSQLQFASTFPREEAYFLLNQFEKWNASAIFCGHVHKWDERFFNNVYYVTLDSMSERNSPEPGDYLVRVTVYAGGGYDIERVHMNYVAPKK
ncbi:MAG: metallophosphoesterase, partial [Muribaculaceae bacterium]|nr:metallophosphoesterase [Muribaculaceae bacterium]